MYDFSRRQFLASTSALAALAGSTAFADSSANVLAAREVSFQLLPDTYDKTKLWRFNENSPNGEIRVKQGSRVTRTLQNDLSQATSIHWHGIRIDNAMDGVSGLTQDAVQPGGNFEYDFIVPDAGTYWYHAHNMSMEQVARGLYGPLIIEESDAPDVDREEVLILDDWLVNPETAQLEGDFEAAHALSHAGRIGNFITTNAAFNLTLTAEKHQRLRLRLINASNARIFPLRLEGLDGWIVALDGMPLSTPQKIAEGIVLAPAQRVDLMVDVIAEAGETAHLVHVTQQAAVSQVAFQIKMGGSFHRRNAPAALPPNDHKMVNIEEATAFTLKMEGGAMGGLQNATMDGKERSMRELVDAGRFWAFNGGADGMDGPPLAQVGIGESVRINIQNDTAFPHAMHLHGMHFRDVSIDGELGPLRDTTLLQRGETREIAFVADNPGQWLLHCHMLSHGAAGMMTRVVVA